MNQKFKPFDNLKIRQAVAYAINRQALVDAFFGDTGVVAQELGAPGTKFLNDLDIPDYDPDKAKALIAESGVTDLSFDFWYPTSVSRPYMPDPKGEFEAILRDLEAVGFKPNPQSAIWNPTTWTPRRPGSTRPASSAGTATGSASTTSCSRHSSGTAATPRVRTPSTRTRTTR